MVLALERPAEQEMQIDRSNGRSFFMGTQFFHMEYGDLFFSSEALIMQLEEEQLTHTLMLGPGGINNQGWRWQLSTTDKAGRKTTELGVSPGGQISGWIATYNPQGAVTEVAPLDDSNWQPAAYTISAIIGSQRMIDFVTETRAGREKHDLALINFSFTHEIGNVILHKAALEKASTNLNERTKKFGFSIMNLHAQPVK